jgi:hypothetical protein
METPMPAWRYSALFLAFLAGCTSYPPTLAPARGQTAAQQETDTKDCDHQVHGTTRSMVAGMFTAWSTEEGDKYVACMQGKGYTPAK